MTRSKQKFNNYLFFFSVAEMTDGPDPIRRDYSPCCPMLIGVYMYERPADLEQPKKRV